MDFRYTLPMRVISTLTLTLFCWVFAGGYDIAYAIKNDQQSAFSGQRSLVNTQQSSASADQPRAGRPEGKLQKTIDDIVQIVQAVQAVQTVEEKNVEKNKLKTKKLEIEALDVEIRTQFAETEEKIRNLPETIKQRHRDFVAKYEENLNELKENLDAIERLSAESLEFEEAIENTKTFLEKVKPPKKHIPIDPNKLPHRSPEVKKPELIEKQPDKKEFKLPSLLKQKAELNYSDEFENSNPSPILVASNGSLTGLLDGSQPSALISQSTDSTLNSELSTQNYLQIALADTSTSSVHTPPTDADLTETIEVQFTPAIIAKATELENKPVLIYSWVRNNIKFVPTYGSIQGANMCLQTKQCNAFDTASLLIALLRASGIHARYVEGTVEIPSEKVMNWVGGFQDPMDAMDIMGQGGIPRTGMLVGSEIKYIRIEHIWVEAWIDYIPSRGARHKQGDTWIRLDASFKQYNYTEGIDIQSAVPFDAQSFVDQITATATINEEEGYVTGVDSLLIQQTMEDYQTQVENYITENNPDATVGDVLGKKEIIQKDFPYLLGTLPYRTIVTGQKTAEIPSHLRHRISFRVVKDIYDELLGTPMNYSLSLPEIAGKKITLSYSPATPEDEAVINSYLPEPHEDGTPIDPAELPTSLSAYLINVKPELRIDGEVIATGSAVGLGVTEEFKMTFSGPGLNANDVITNDLQAGEYLGIALDLGRISEEQMLLLKAKLEATKAKLESEDFTGITKDDLLGDLFYTTALSYYAELDASDHLQAKTMGVVAVRLPSEAHFSYELSVYSLWGIPMSVSSDGLAMDVDRTMVMVKALDGDNDKKVQFVLASGMNGSALEHSVPERLFSTPDAPAYGISAVKAIQIANDQGIPIYTVNQTNIDSILPQLEVDAGTITDIKNAVNAGMEVTVSKTDITFNGWTGVGYIIIDPNTGAGAYMISGGLSGGILFFAIIINWFISLFVSDAEAAEYIASFPEGDCLYFHFVEYLDCLATNLDFVELSRVVLMIAFGLGSKSLLKWHPLYGYVIAAVLYIGIVNYLAGKSNKCGEEATHCDDE